MERLGSLNGPFCTIVPSGASSVIVLALVITGVPGVASENVSALTSPTTSIPADPTERIVLELITESIVFSLVNTMLARAAVFVIAKLPVSPVRFMLPPKAFAATVCPVSLTVPEGAFI